MNLGYPIEGPFPCWVIEIKVGNDVGIPKVVPVAFSPEQAREIARRIVSYYLMTEEKLV